MAAAHPDRPSFPPSLSVVVPTRNRLPLLRYLLASLRLQAASAQSYEVIVVDDASSDGTASWVAGQRFPFTTTVRVLPQQGGRARARNAGLEVAAGDVVAFLDGDVLAPPTLVGAHRDLHAGAAVPICVTGYPWFWAEVQTWRFAAPEGPVLDPACLDSWAAVERWAGGPLAPRTAGGRTADPDAAPYLWCVTRDVSVPRAVAIATGGFDEGFCGYGLEDWEFGYRLAEAGVRFASDPAASVWHQAHPPGDRRPVDLVRNYAVFLQRHPDAEVGAMPFCPPWADQGRYARLVASLRRLSRAAPSCAAAAREVAVSAGREWVRRGGWPAPPLGWQGWAARWGTVRLRRIEAELAAALVDVRMRPAAALLQELAGR